MGPADGAGEWKTAPFTPSTVRFDNEGLDWDLEAVNRYIEKAYRMTGCEVCGVKPGEPCTKKDGRPYRREPYEHSSRTAMIHWRAMRLAKNRSGK